MAVVRKVTSKVAKASEEIEVKDTSANVDPSDGKASGTKKTAAKAKKCVFCANGTEPKYWDAAALRRYVSDRGRIIPRTRTNLCAKHQRKVTKQIKYARHLALLPFLVRV